MEFAGRIASAILVIWLAATLAFFALRILPGDAIEAQLVHTGASESDIEQRRTEQGLTGPVWVQYGRFLFNAVRGDFGFSLLSGQPVTELIAQNLVPTVTLALAAVTVATVMGVILGTVGGLSLTGFSLLARTIMSLSLSVPIYWTGTLAIIIFAAQLGLLPSAGAGRPSQLMLPVAVLGFHTAGAIARVVQANVRQTLTADFVTVARAKGLSETHIVVRHVLRASLPSVITVVALQAGFLLSGTVITESLFVRPGLGRLLLNATLQQDYPVVQGVVVLTAAMYTFVNMGSDGVFRILDPRVAAY
jgi:peptide/nickel transport system permease protein